MVIKRNKSRVIPKVETPRDESIVPGKLTDLKMMSGLNLLLMAEKKAREGSSSSLSATSSASFLHSPDRSVSFPALPARNSTVQQPFMSNSALLQLAEMCSSELRSATKDKLSSTGHVSSLQINTPVLAGSPCSRISSVSTATCNQSLSPSEMHNNHWTKFESMKCNSTTSNISRGDNSLFISSLPSQNLSVATLRCAPIESHLSPGAEYPSIERYKPTRLGRKLSSSSATESIPSPSTSFEDEAEGDESYVLSQEFEMPKVHKHSTESTQEILDLSNSQFFATLLSKTRPANAQKSLLTLGHHPTHTKPYPHVNPPSIQKPQDFSQQNQQLITSSGQMPRQLLLTENELATSSKPSTYRVHENQLVSFNTQQSPDLKADGNVDTHSLDKNKSNFQLWREPGASAASHGTISSSESQIHQSPPSMAVSDYSPHNQMMNFSAKRQQQCMEGPPRLVSEGCVDNQMTNPSSDLKSSYATCRVSFAETPLCGASLPSEGRLASLLSNSAPAQKFSLGVSDLSHRTDHETQKDNSVFNMRVGFGQFHEENFQMFRLPSTANNRDGLTMSLPGKQPEVRPTINKSTLTGQATTFSKGKLKKKWTERMLIESKREEFLEQCRVNGKVESQENALTTTSDVRPSSCRDSSCRVSPGEQLSVETCRHLSNSQNLYMGHSKRADELKIFTSFGTEGSRNYQTTHSLSQPLVSLKAMLSQTHEPASFNASRHPKLMLQLSQNQQLLKPDQLKLQMSFGDVQIKSELEVSGLTNHRHHLSHLDPKESVGESRNSGRDYIDKNIHRQITGSENKYVNNVVGQSRVKDFSEHSQNLDTHCSSGSTESFSWEKPLSAFTVKSEIGQDIGKGVGAVKEDTVGGFLKQEAALDFSMMTASTLVERVIRKVCGTTAWRDGSSLYQDVFNARVEQRHIQSNCDSPPSQTLTSTFLQSSEAGKIESNQSAEADASRQSPATATKSCDLTKLATDVQPIRKSGRANRGQKYQELIKEGVIHPSKERLAARNVEKQEKNARDFIKEQVTQPTPIHSINVSNKRTRRRRCDSETIVLATSDPDITHDVSAYRPHSALASSCSKVVPSGGPASRYEVGKPVPEFPTDYIHLPKNDNLSNPITGSRKRKARKHSITRILFVDEVKEADKKLISSKLYPAPHKKPCQLATQVSHVS